MGRFSSAVDESRNQIFASVEEGIRNSIESHGHYYEFTVLNLRDASYVEAACDEFDAELREDGLGIKLINPLYYDDIKAGKRAVMADGLRFVIMVVPAGEVPPRRASSSGGSSSSGSSSSGSSSGGWQ